MFDGKIKAVNLSYDDGVTQDIRIMIYSLSLIRADATNLRQLFLI